MIKINKQWYFLEIWQIKQYNQINKIVEEMIFYQKKVIKEELNQNFKLDKIKIKMGQEVLVDLQNKEDKIKD